MKRTDEGKSAAEARASRGTLLLALLVGLAAGILTAVLIAVLPSGGPAPANTQSMGRALIGGPFALTDGSGKRVTDKDFAGRPMLVFFGYTHCPDICPAGLQVMAAALEKLGDKAKGLTPIFITLDPERDTPELVGKYAASFDKAIVGLSGAPEDVAAAIKAYRVYAKKVPDEANPADYTMDHSSFMYLMDANGTFAKHFPSNIDANALAEALAKAVETPAPPPA